MLSKNATFQCCKQDYDASHQISLHSDDSPLDVWDRYYRTTFTGTSKSHCKNCKVSADSNLDASAIIIAKDDIKFLDSNCFFDHCRNATGEGATIHFECQSSIIQQRTCSIGCLSYENDAHSYSFLISQNSFPNLVIESSIELTKSPKSASISFLFSGIIGVSSSNFSKNEVYTCSGFQNHIPNQMSITNFSSFCHNRLHDSCVLYHDLGSFKDYMCNFIDSPWNIYIEYKNFSTKLLRISGYVYYYSTNIV